MTRFISILFFWFYTTTRRKFPRTGQDLRTTVIHVLRYPPSLARASILKRAKLLAISCKQNYPKLNPVQPSDTKKNRRLVTSP